MEKKVIRVLNVVPNMRAAGIETFIMNVYRNIDRSKVQFDFLVHNQEEEFFDEEIKKLGGKIYRLSFKDDKNIFKYIKDLNKFFKEHKEYKIVHGHMQSMMPLYLYIAKRNKVPVRIAHCHRGNFSKTLKGIILHIFSRFAKYFSTDNFACSDVAGKYLFKNNKYEIIYNGINIEKFQFDAEKRKEIREKMSVHDEYIIGHIGRFELEKNHKFLINVMKSIKNKKVVLWLIGEGTLEADIKKLVKKEGLENVVQFLGLRSDVNDLYQAMDCFVLPSFYEGLPVVGIEAQVAGLECLFSNNITKELKVSDKVKYLSINKNNINEWKKEIENLINKQDENRNIKKSEYRLFNIKYISDELLKKYIYYSSRYE